MKIPASSRTLPTLRRALGALLALMVFALGLVNASPDVHAYVHRHLEAEADCGHANHAHSAPVSTPEHVCAVVMFAGGAEPASPLFLPTPVLTLAEVIEAGYARPLLLAPRYLRQPERGPPAV